MEEAFKYMELEMTREKAKSDAEAEKFFLDYLSRMYSNAPVEGETAEFKQARKKFFETIEPKKDKADDVKPIKSKELGWGNIPQEELEKAERLYKEGVQKGG